LKRNCSSCWAFAAAGAMEHRHYASTGHRYNLSPKMLVDCSGSHGQFITNVNLFNLGINQLAKIYN